jgi:antitoxin component of MazEF toxin-antitoxin module
MKLRAKILLSGKTATGIEVPTKVVEALGTSKRPAVQVTVNGYTYRSSIASMGGKFMLSVSEKVRQNAGVAAGDTVEFDIVLDTEPRAVVVPDDFQQALDLDPAARQTFAGLSYSNQRRLVIPIETAKAAETRQRRIEKTVALLHEGKS